MLFTTIASAFFIEPRDHAPTLERLVRLAGMTEVTPLDEANRSSLGLRDPGREVLGGGWGPFGITWSTVDAVDGLACVQLYSSMNRYLDLQIGTEAGAEDPLLACITAFCDACLGLAPLAAFFDPHAHYGDERWENKQGSRERILSYAPVVARFDADALADERFSLLYLGEPLAGLWNPSPVRDDRDLVEVPEGRLVFARSGPHRMA